MEKSFAFNSIDGDRMYKAEDFTAYFASFIGNGIFPNPATNLQVIDNNDMTITIKSGKAWINGYFYINTEDFILKLSLADGVLNRIDRVVLRLDFNKRSINLYVKKGEFASSAIPKQLERNSDIFELGIADISIKAGSISITQNNITDLRLNKEYCGIVHGVVEQVDTTSIFNQFQSWYSNKQNEFDKDIDTWTKQKKKGFETWLTQNTQNFLDKLNNFYDTNNKEFEKWFNALKEKLKGDVATNLLNEVSATKEEVEKNKKEIDTLKVNIENTDKKIDGIELTAEKVTIKDTGNLFSSNNVEGALKEVFTNVDNGKKLLRQAIIDKDNKVSVSMNPSFNDLKNSIGKIKTGVVTGDSIKNDKLGLEKYTLTNVLPFPNYFGIYGRYYNYKNGSYAISYVSLIRHDSDKKQNEGVVKVFNKYNELLVTQNGRCEVVFLEDNSFLIISKSNFYHNDFVYYYNSAGQLINTSSLNNYSESTTQIVPFKDEILFMDIKNSNNASLYNTKECKLYSNCRNFKNNDYSKISTRTPCYSYKGFYYRFIRKGFYETVIEKYRYDNENKQLSVVSTKLLTNIDLNVYGEVVPVQLPSVIVGFKDNMLITVLDQYNQIRMDSNIRNNDDLDITYDYTLRYYNLDTLEELKTNKITSRYRYHFIGETENSFVACERADWFIGVSGRQYLKENDHVNMLGREMTLGHKIGRLSESLILK